jgi:tetratricopeptide (TPR) repeat protein
MPSPTLRQLGIAVACCLALMRAGNAADDASEINRLFSAGQTSEAFAKLDALIAAKPRDPAWRFQKGVLLAEARRPSEAAAIFTQLTVDYPDIPEPYNNLAVIQAARGDYDRARASLDAAIRAKPDYAVAHLNLGDVYAQLARSEYLRTQALDPSNATVAPKLALIRELVKPAQGAPSVAAPAPAPATPATPAASAARK